MHTRPLCLPPRARRTLGPRGPRAGAGTDRLGAAPFHPCRMRFPPVVRDAPLACHVQGTAGELCVPGLCDFLAKASCLTLYSTTASPRRADTGLATRLAPSSSATFRGHHVTSGPARPVYQPAYKDGRVELGVHTRHRKPLGLRKVHEPFTLCKQTCLCQSPTVYLSPGQQGGLERQAEGEAAWP